MVFECYFFKQLHCIYKYGLHYNEMMMSVLQEVKGLTKKIILHYNYNYTSSRKTSFHAKCQAQCLHGLPVLVQPALSHSTAVLWFSIMPIHKGISILLMTSG